MTTPTIDAPIAEISTPLLGVLVVALVGALLALVKAETWFQGFRGSSWSSILGAALAGLVYFVVQVVAEALVEMVWGSGHQAGRILAVLASVAYFAVWYMWVAA